MTTHPISPPERDDRARLESEKRFHDQRFTESPRTREDRYYAALPRAFALYRERVLAAARGATVLELGSAQGEWSRSVAGEARELVGIDISAVAAHDARAAAAAAGIANAHYAVMNAEQTALPTGRFDLVFGSGIIHHLDLERSYAEVARLLRPGGSAIFLEPLGHNPAINLYRRLTPHARTPDEHPLRRRDFALARRFFSGVSTRFFGFTALASIPFLGSSLFEPALAAGTALDRALERVPGLRWAFWYCCMTLTR